MVIMILIINNYKNLKDGTDNNDAVNKNQMEHYIENGDLDIQGSINFRRGSISIDGTNSQGITLLFVNFSQVSCLMSA